MWARKVTLWGVKRLRKIVDSGTAPEYIGIKLFERAHRSGPVTRESAGGQAQMDEDLGTHRGIVDRGEERQRAATLWTVGHN